jgi:hypothetical protein
VREQSFENIVHIDKQDSKKPETILLSESTDRPARTYPFIQPTQTQPLPFHLYTRPITVNGITIDTKYCTTCKTWRPPRASHCSECDACVEKYDHYCPWMGTCVGKRNYFMFFLFLWSVLLNSLTLLSSGIYFLSHFTVAEVVKEPVALGLVIFTGLITWSLAGMAGYHTWLASQNITTHEEVFRFNLDKKDVSITKG